MSSYEILYVLDFLSETSIPLDWTTMLYDRGWDIALLPVEPLKNQIEPENIEGPVIRISIYRRGDPRVLWKIRQKIRTVRSKRGNTQ